MVPRLLRERAGSQLLALLCAEKPHKRSWGFLTFPKLLAGSGLRQT